MARIESDAYGSVELPDEALYGVQTWRSVSNMTFSPRKLRDFPAYIAAMAEVKIAAARANERAGLVPARIAQTIQEVCGEIASGKYNEHFIVDAYHGGGSIGSNMNMNEVAANLASERLGGRRGTYDPVSPSDHVNASQSTNDVCHSAMRIAILRSGRHLGRELDRLAAAFADKAEELAGVATITRTCLQDAMADTLGNLFAGYAAGLRRRKAALAESIERLHAVNIGGTVIGSGVGAPDAYRQHILADLSDVTGLPLCCRDSLYDASQNMDDIAAVSKELQLLSGFLIKVAKDLRLLSSGPEAGFGELRLPAVQAGSSFFPGKVNPVVPETLVQCCFQVIGLDRSVQASLEHGELNLNIWEGLAGINILDAMGMLERSVGLFTDNCVAGIQANEERCRALSQSFIPVVVALKEKHGYAKVSQWLAEESKETILHRWEEEAAR